MIIGLWGENRTNSVTQSEVLQITMYLYYLNNITMVYQHYFHQIMGFYHMLLNIDKSRCYKYILTITITKTFILQFKKKISSFYNITLNKFEISFN